MGVNGVNQQLSNMIDRFSYLGTGIVVITDPFLATIMIGETQVRAAYVRELEPDAGSVVAVMRQGASWFVLGTTSVSGGNSVQNPGFEQINEDNTPALWVLYNISGTNVMTALESPGEAVTNPLEPGDNVLEVGPVGGVSGSSFVYSAPIAVVPGQIWELSSYYNGNYPGDNPDTVDISLRAFWFANATDLYPATSDVDSIVATVNNITQEDTMRVIRGNVTVPGGAVFMRVVLRTGAPAFTGAHYDYVTARQVG